LTVKATTLLLADDHPLFRDGLRALVARLSGYEVVAETGDGSDALALIRERRPDIAILDIGLPGMSGLDVARAVAAECPETRVVIVSAHADQEYVQRALKSGVSAYLAKDSTASELEVALSAAQRGGTFLSPTIAGGLTQDYLKRIKDSPDIPLTTRQHEVLRLIAQGLNTKEIAHRLGLSVKTVETHRTEIMERLDIRDIAGLTRYAIRKGLVSAAP
jgi:DNA-binding NarL/FixJ family response regulator